MVPLQKIIQAFKEHISSFVEEPVSLEWPIGEERAVHVYVYSVSEDIHSRTSEVRRSPNDDQFVVVRALVFSNPEYEYGSLGRVVQGLRQHPTFQSDNLRIHVMQLPISTDEVTQIFVARKQRYRLTVAYEIRSQTIDAVE